MFVRTVIVRTGIHLGGRDCVNVYVEDVCLDLRVVVPMYARHSRRSAVTDEKERGPSIDGYLPGSLREVALGTGEGWVRVLQHTGE